ncbi:uncharacterized protein LOC129778189 [Toxorhynchites rutilus septentrionalis]|uniref:uncharacterized protein LOC129778189 n=1 Tax=Toxorhynchites rutilus septentrionalis TaxID=329112 RepID=UPI00247AFB54|nr:uncharacterized protein LOC129778189 [Toxorhynchites rutilus septentrionalis]XP_055640911.1 uncharacterized protein LOC129778189 [Toxorhynchites rutilus septentrionalis]
MTEYVPPQLITVLKTYQDNAPKSLHGPGLSLVHPSKGGQRPESPEHGDEELIVQPIVGPLPIPSHPIMTTPDPDCGVVQLTMLEGKKIGCFLLGGEMRLCLPQIFNNILMEFSVEQINRSIQELMVYLYNCTDQQLQEFKRANIIPDTAKTCGLITRTNAERLCSYMLHQADGTRNLKGATTFRVYHRCFGKCEGIFTAELYSFKEPACIECCECQGMFSPQKFVCHQHDRHENRTCHWGFNSSNWRAYIHVALDEPNRDAYAKILEEIWNQERDTEMELELEREYWIAKRKVIDESTGLVTIKTEPLGDIPMKKPKLINEATLYQYSRQPSSAFRPWTQKAQKYAQQQLLLQHMAFNGNGIINGSVGGVGSPGGILALSQEPPVLQNPESVVRLSESDKFERSFQPNVALVPRKTVLCKERERERERERLSSDKERSVIKCDVQIKQESPPTPPADMIRSVIKCDVKIKQEQPPTPPPPELSPGPQVPSAPQSPLLPPVGAQFLVGGLIKSVPLPYSPVTDVHSGSNEITSSTSPVPPAVIMNTMNGCIISEKPKLLVNEQISPPSPRRTPLLNEDLHNHRSHLPSSAVILKNGGDPAAMPGAPIVGNPEFELSTDTDDDSLAGEPDSSNNSMAPLDIIGDVMKDVAHETRDQILNIFKLLIQETAQIRNEHLRLLQDHKQKDDLIVELQRDRDELQQQVAQLQQQLNRSLKIATTEASVLQMQQQHQHELAAASVTTVNGSAPSSTPPSPVSLASNSSNNQQVVVERIERRNSFPEKSDVIMKPLKKSLRRSPDDSVLILQSPPPPPPPPCTLALSIPASLSITATSLKPDPIGSGEDEDKPQQQQQQLQHPTSNPSVLNSGSSSTSGVIASPSPRPPSRPTSAASTASNVSTSSPQSVAMAALENSSSSKASSNAKDAIKCANN